MQKNRQHPSEVLHKVADVAEAALLFFLTAGLVLSVILGFVSMAMAPKEIALAEETTQTENNATENEEDIQKPEEKAPVQTTLEMVKKGPDILTSETVLLTLKENGSVWSWGYNDYGEMGDGTTNVGFTSTLSAVKGVGGEGNLENVVQIEGHRRGNGFALLADGTAVGWGRAPVGNGKTEHAQTPEKLVTKDGSTLQDVVQIAAVGSLDGGLVALKSDGSVWVMGSSILAGTQEAPAYFVQVMTKEKQPFTNIKKIATSLDSETIVALDQEGVVWVWGKHQVLYGASQYRFILEYKTPTKMPVLKSDTPLSDIVDIAAGLALTKDGNVYAWGSNSRGELGNGNIPEKIEADITFQGASLVLEKDAPLENVISIAGNLSIDGPHIVKKQDGTLMGWGDNNMGLFGDEKVVALPVALTSLENIAQFRIGKQRLTVIKEDNSVWLQGSSAYLYANSGKTGNSSELIEMRTTKEGEQLLLLGMQAIAVPEELQSENPTMWLEVERGSKMPLYTALGTTGLLFEEVEWQSSDIEIAAVDAKGIVSANKLGKAIIYATASADKEQLASVGIIVIEPKVEALRMEVKIEIGMSVTMIATDNKGEMLEEVGWKSSDDKIAQVDETGKVIARSPGVAKISAQDKEGKTKAVFYVRVPE